MTVSYLVGDVFDRLAGIPDDSIDLIVTSPPFLALRSYLPDGHPDKAKEIGSEPTPAAFLDTLLDLTDEWGRVLAPHGSLCVELGDTYAGSGGAGGDYAEGGIREGQNTFTGSARRMTASVRRDKVPVPHSSGNSGPGWPQPKCKTMLDTLYPASLAYGRNLLRPEHQVTPWLIRNRITWARPNPPVGALGDKFRPATSMITVACQGPRRWFDLDAVRTPPQPTTPRYTTTERNAPGQPRQAFNVLDANGQRIESNPAGAPPLDWHADGHPEDGDWLWVLPTRGYKGAHHAVFPLALPKKLILAMCPIRVCRTCGTPSERLTDTSHTANRSTNGPKSRNKNHVESAGFTVRADKHTTTTGWTTCGCDGTDGIRLDGFHDGAGWRPGVVLDPFAGSGTTLEAAQLLSRDAIGIDIDARNADLAYGRVGMFMEAHHG